MINPATRMPITGYTNARRPSDAEMDINSMVTEALAFQATGPKVKSAICHCPACSPESTWDIGDILAIAVILILAFAVFTGVMNA